MSKAIAFLAGLGTGYMKAEDKKVEDARKAASDKREQDLFDAKLRTSGLQADAAQMTLDKGKRDEAAAVFDMGVKEALQRGGPEALATFMSESHGDGQAGKLKFKAVTSPDGKWQMHKLNEDGTTAPIGGAFTADETGYATAGLMLSKGVSEKDKAAHLLQVKQQADSAANSAAQLKIAQKNADTNEQWRKDQAENMRQQRALEDKRIKAAVKAVEVPPGVTWDKEADAFLRTRYTVKDADGAETVDGGGLLFAKQLSVAIASRNGGDTTAAMGAAFQADNKLKAEAGGDPEKLRIGRVQRLQSLMAPTPAASAAPAAPGAAKPVAPTAITGQNKANVPATPPARPVPPTTPAAVAAQGVAPPVAVTPAKAEVMAPLNAQVEQASAVLRTVAASGDKAAIQKYAALVEQARAERLKRATSLFGPQEAQQYLSTLPM